MEFEGMNLLPFALCSLDTVIILWFVVLAAWAAQSNVLGIPWAPSFVTLSVAVRPGWRVEFRCNHDDHELTCVIRNLTQGKEERYPELMLDP